MFTGKIILVSHRFLHERDIKHWHRTKSSIKSFNTEDQVFFRIYKFGKESWEIVINLDKMI